MAKINFGGVVETVVTRKEYPLKRAQAFLKKETIAIIGYGVQGPAQALNMRDNGINVIIGQDKKFANDWKRAEKDGFKAGKTLFDIEEACEKASIVMILLNDAAIKHVWARIQPFMTEGKALYFSHGFGWVYRKLTGVKVSADVDVIMVASTPASPSHKTRQARHWIVPSRSALASARATSSQPASNTK
jgi:ketol-acid reductoisomerase